ncbi:MAG: CO dehydrogenase/acetyl-CoA synthase subunit delta [archaeon]|nr:CO dehydrogenase/acetyl-CoA synthase subunit delta [archaeon]MCP8315008.1 CO dehydrogenase/acetyl-CoA synthase subunit delta [archaeon]MCP8315634.1 CO dehydrogenase/acetyl-CoA synthase subunit delta [archaeon]MCP8321832.1 CO dehydrogenase/acetyl-CoA synthase subunit delta [archaeon]
MEEKEVKALTKSLIQLIERFGDLEIENVEIRAEELTLILQPIIGAVAQAPQLVPRVEKAIETLLKAEFLPPIEAYPGGIAEVQIGATRSDGGSRRKVIKIGGEKTMPFYSFEALNPNKPAFAMDVFDMPIVLAKSVTQHFEDVMHDPADWAKKCVEDFGADIVSLNLISTDPFIKDTSTKDAAKTVERVLQAVDVPLIIGGSGNKAKDPLVLEAAAEVASGERCILNSANVDNDYKRIVRAAKQYGHIVVAFTPMDINNQKKLNRLLLDEGLPKEQIIMDPTTAALGYGLDHTLSLMERIKLAGLLGDPNLQMPILAPTSNSWGAREAWMKSEEWGPREYRGPLWETVTAITAIMAGGDLLMLSHPATVRVMKKLIENLYGEVDADQRIQDWITDIGL